MIRIQSGRQIAAVWLGALAIFVATAWGSTLILPADAAAVSSGPPASYYVGLLGLLAVGLALVLTWRRVGRSGPTSTAARTVLQALLAVGTVLWLAAMAFPFL